eukprot:CAMPEP_0184491800 /NCGR_PEP_ID=MMETSP0113_2-20130426/21384_1 /TAXON_ID=91329 /ORGANISM="Norrisiella sphaerica, Strain BC52" /LENGTH=311 /DNA_ID=CAMNT_0026876323 /DNA_START=347 /DNA_END=1278 /DNA_ORIENTATION=+
MAQETPTSFSDKQIVLHLSSFAKEDPGEIVRALWLWLPCQALTENMLESLEIENSKSSNSLSSKSILELGAGTGIVSIFLSKVWKGRLVVTDRSEAALQVIALNLALNQRERKCGETKAMKLSWGPKPYLRMPETLCAGSKSDEMKGDESKEKFGIIIASDVCYHDDMIQPLWQTISWHLSRAEGAYFLMSHELRFTETIEKGQVIREKDDTTLIAFIEAAKVYGFRLQLRKGVQWGKRRSQLIGPGASVDPVPSSETRGQIATLRFCRVLPLESSQEHRLSSTGEMKVALDNAPDCAREGRSQSLFPNKR